MHCPTCHCEYEDWATVCSDCEVALVPGAPPEPAPATPARRFSEADLRDWTVLTNVPNALVGNVLKDQLDQADIPVLMKRSWGSDIAEFSHNDWVTHDIYVPRRFLDQARRVQHGTPDGGALWAMPPAWAATAAGAEAPEALPDPAPPPAALLTLSQHQARLDERKHHRSRPPAAPRAVAFPADSEPFGLPPAVAPGALDYDPEPDWPPTRRRVPLLESRVYRFLMGLLLLAWVLPFLLQFLQAFADRWFSWLR
jgi:hypothetical protein